MKNAIFLSTVIVSATLTGGQLYAQSDKAHLDLSITHPGNGNGQTNASSGASVAHESAAGTVNFRAIKDFQSRYAHASGEQWSRADRGFCAYCTDEGYKVRAFYDLKGHWQASVKYCDETQLPYAIRDVVKRTYYDLAISNVIIVQVPEHTAYLVYLEDKTTLKIVRVSDEGEMEVEHDYVKTN
jgi:hypothetical protein